MSGSVTPFIARHHRHFNAETVTLEEWQAAGGRRHFSHKFLNSILGNGSRG